MTSVQAGLVTRSPQRLAADPSRVITRLFVPGQEGFEHQESRAGAVLARILALDEERGAGVVGRRRQPVRRPSPRSGSARSAATPANSPTVWIPTQNSPRRECCCWVRHSPASTPSKVRRCATRASWRTPTRREQPAGSLRFVMSVRGIGEGHRSSIGFRTGVIDAAGDVPRSTTRRRSPPSGRREPALLDAAVFRSELARLDDAGEAADYVLDGLGERFTRADLDERLGQAPDDR